MLVTCLTADFADDHPVEIESGFMTDDTCITHRSEAVFVAQQPMQSVSIFAPSYPDLVYKI